MYPSVDHWFRGPLGARALGLRAVGGGVHASKTMMLADLTRVLAHDSGQERNFGQDQRDFRKSIIDENLLGKRSQAARSASFSNLRRLYGFGTGAPVSRALTALWPDATSRPMLATLCTTARDPLFRVSVGTVLDTPIGEQMGSRKIAADMELAMPGRFGTSTLRALAERCASSWHQGGYLTAGPRKRRQRAAPDSRSAAFAAFLGLAAGFSASALLGSPWLDLLDVEYGMRLSLLRQAEADGLLKLRSAGHVFDIELDGELRRIAEGTAGGGTFV